MHVDQFKFRGKRKSDGIWIYGSLVNNLWAERETGKSVCYILFGEVSSWDDIDGREDDFEVINETVGLFTGLQDKKGIEIFTKDIIKTPYGNAVVVFDGGCFYLNTVAAKLKLGGRASKHFLVLGDLYDNPEITGKWRDLV